MKKNKKQGFSLIELLVVVAIMGLLAAMSIISLNTARARARDARRLSDVKQIQTALEMYFNDSRKYPHSNDGYIEDTCLSNDSDGDGVDFESSVCATGADVYMAKIPQNPKPRGDGDCIDKPYTYSRVTVGDETNASYYIVYCLGSSSGDIDEGPHHATPAGIIDP